MSTASREGSSRSAAIQGESDPTAGEMRSAAPEVEQQGVGAAPRKRLSWVPSQRGPAAAEQLSAGTRHRRRVVALVAAVAVVATAGVAYGDDAIATLGHDDASSKQSVAAGELPETTAHAHAVDAARLALVHAEQTLAAATHVKPGQSDALRASSTSLQSLVDDATSTAAALTAATSQLTTADAALAGAETAAVAAQVAAADAAKAAAQHAAAQKAAAQKAAAQKAAAKKAAAQKAAAQKAAAQKAAQKSHATTTHSTMTHSTTKSPTKTPVKTTTTSTVRSTSGTAALSRVPSGGLTCTSRGAGAHSASASSLGAAINAYRAKHGLKKLRIVTSSSLVQHSLQMANTGGIWHSGHDNIVGCVSNASYSYLVQAWDHSAPHRAQMRRTGISTMYIGDALRGSWLYGAVFFS
jgi:hypothetical protein